MTESRFAIIPADAIDDLRLSATDLRVLGVIAYHAGRDRSAWPKQKTIADRLQITREAVNRSISRLKKWGYVEVTTQTRRDGGQRENVYFVPLDPALARQAIVSNGEADPQGAPPPCDPTITPPVIAAITPITKEQTIRTNPHSPLMGARRDASLENMDPLVVSAFEVVWKQWPAKGLERSASRDICFRAFTKAAAKAGPEALKMAAAQYVAKTKAPYAIGLDKWLRRGAFEHFLPTPATVARTARRQLMRVSGRAGDCLDAIVNRYGEPTARAWLADARWTETLVELPSDFQAAQVYTRFAPVLELHGFAVTTAKAVA